MAKAKTAFVCTECGAVIEKGEAQLQHFVPSQFLKHRLDGQREKERAEWVALLRPYLRGKHCTVEQ